MISKYITTNIIIIIVLTDLKVIELGPSKII